MSSTKWASPDASFEFIAATMLRLLSSGIHVRVHQHFENINHPHLQGQIWKQEVLWNSCLCVPDDRASYRTRKQYNLQFYWGTWEIIEAAGYPHVSLRAQNELSNSLIDPSIPPARQSRCINQQKSIYPQLLRNDTRYYLSNWPN